MVYRLSVFACFLLALCSPAFARPVYLSEQSQSPVADSQLAVERTQQLIREVIAASYPELAGADVRVTTFADDADYFRTGFSISRFLSGRKMRYVIRVNPRVFVLHAPEDGVRAIVAHELGHVFDFHRQKRIFLLGLVRLAAKGPTARFERWTDLQAIRRGYGDGLKAYRTWLYQNVPDNKLAEKRRNYFSPEEIDAMQTRLKQQPELMERWLKQVPRNLAEIEARNKSVF